jgi:hypothetical protein
MNTEIRSIEILLTLTRLLNVRWKGRNDISSRIKSGPVALRLGTPRRQGRLPLAQWRISKGASAYPMHSTENNHAFAFMGLACALACGS